MRTLAVVLGALVLTGVSPPSWLTLRTNGLSVHYPPSWHATARRLTAVISPPLRFAITSYPLRQKGPRKHMPAGEGSRRDAGGRCIHLRHGVHRYSPESAGLSASSEPIPAYTL